MKVIDPEGNIVQSTKMVKGESEAHINISTLNNGAYTVVLLQDSYTPLSRKVIVIN